MYAQNTLSCRPMTDALRFGEPLYNLLYVGGIIFFCYFYTSIIFNPNEIADNMRKYGGFIPGIRPGKTHGRVREHDPDPDHAGRRSVSGVDRDHSGIHDDGFPRSESAVDRTQLWTRALPLFVTQGLGVHVLSSAARRC